MSQNQTASADPIPRRSEEAIGLDGCRIQRVLDHRVEIVDASAYPRHFPERVSDSFGLCVKYGPAHDVRADGRELYYPENTLCVRSPGCVWSVRATGPAAFLSVDIEPALLPPGGVRGSMKFLETVAFPDLRQTVAALREHGPPLRQDTIVARLVDAALERGLVDAPGLHWDAGGAVSRARDLLVASFADPPSLHELSVAVGANRFVLLRHFRQRFGVPPYSFVLRLRVERARTMLARGSTPADVAASVGFADQSHLSRIFKQVVGVTPAAYRRATWIASR